MARVGIRPRSRPLFFVLGAVALVVVAAAVIAQADPSTLLPISTGTFCPTAGTVVGAGPRSFRVDTAGMRGVIASDKSRSGEIAFVYRGPSKVTEPLANGELRQQIGLKLRAQDTCNVVYVMWHLAPEPGIAVSLKSNPGQSTHAECLDRGYVTPKPISSAPAPLIAEGEPHTLHAEIDGATVTVHADGIEVSKVTLPDAVFTFDGAVGVRSDNGTFDFELRIPGGGHAGARCANPSTELAH